jgi:hypothetical protein
MTCLVLFLSAAGCKSGADEAREEIEAEQKKAAAEKAAEEAARPPPPVRTIPPDAAEPTTPEEIDRARKQAMIDGRDKDVIKYCEMQGVTEKSDPQILLGCTLAACRIKDSAKAQAWAKPLPKELKTEAVRVCQASEVTL